MIPSASCNTMNLANKNVRPPWKCKHEEGHYSPMNIVWGDIIHLGPRTETTHSVLNVNQDPACQEPQLRSNLQAVFLLQGYVFHM